VTLQRLRPADSEDAEGARLFVLVAAGENGANAVSQRVDLTKPLSRGDYFRLTVDLAANDLIRSIATTRWPRAVRSRSRISGMI
jgi:hypothetical protein